MKGQERREKKGKKREENREEERREREERRKDEERRGRGLCSTIPSGQSADTKSNRRAAFALRQSKARKREGSFV